MSASFLRVPPRQVEIDDAASFLGTTPLVIRQYHEMGLLPEPELSGDGQRRYGYNEMIRLLWVCTMVDAGIAVDDVRDAFADAAAAGTDAGYTVAGTLQLSVLSDVVTGRFTDLPEGSLRQADLDSLLVTERILGPLGAGVQASRFIALATNPGLREACDRVDVAEAALDDTIAIDDPRVARVAGERYAFEEALNAFITDSGMARDEDALFDAWDAAHADTADEGGSLSVAEAVAMMPYDWSPARLASMELAEQLGAKETSGS